MTTSRWYATAAFKGGHEYVVGEGTVEGPNKPSARKFGDHVASTVEKRHNQHVTEVTVTDLDPHAGPGATLAYTRDAFV